MASHGFSATARLSYTKKF